MLAFPALAAWQTRIDNHAVTRFVIPHLGTHLNDVAKEFMSHNHTGGDHLSGRHMQCVDITATNACRAYFQQYLIRFLNFGNFDLFYLQNAVSLKDCCLHERHHSTS